MKVFTSYYGASRDSGIGTRAQSVELNDVLIKNMLVDLSAFRAISAQEKDNEALMYLLKKDGKSILGLSYTEPPSSSGYNRAAPCGIQYVCDAGEMNFDQIGSIVNFAVFKKPDSELPAPLSMIPVNDSGYMFHNNPAALAQVIDALVKVALSEGNETALIVLPQGRNSEYTTARYTISEALGYLPKDLRSRISFFTSLPVSGENYDVLTAFDTANRYGANVIFCSADNYQKLKSRRRFIEANMDSPVQTGAFAWSIARDKEPACFLKLTEQTIEGNPTYESLNEAAQRVASGNAATVDELRKRIKEYEDAIKEKQNKIAELNSNLKKEKMKREKENEGLISKLKDAEEERKKLKKENDELKGRSGRPNGAISQAKKQKAATNPFMKKLLAISIAIAMIGLGFAAGWLISNAVSSNKNQKTIVETESEQNTEQEQTVEAEQSTETNPATEHEHTTEQVLPDDSAVAGEPSPPAEPDQTNEPEPELELGEKPEPTDNLEPDSEEQGNAQESNPEQEPPADLKSTEKTAQSAEPELISDSVIITEPAHTDEHDEKTEQLPRTEPIVIDTDLPSLIIYTDFGKEQFEVIFGGGFEVREYSEGVLSTEEINNSVVVLLIEEKELADKPELNAQENDILVYSYIFDEEQDKYKIKLNGSVVEDFKEELGKLIDPQPTADTSEGNE